MIKRDFRADLAMSEAPDVVRAMKMACHAHWPELLNVYPAHTDNDRLGVDYWLEFPQGKLEALDVKVRQKDWSLYGDDRTACLELVSNTRTGKVGWTLDRDKRTDWVMFFYIETGKAFVYNARQLRSSVMTHMPTLKASGKPSVQSTANYQSESLFVSHRELGAAIYRHSHVTSNMKAIAA